MGSTDIYTVLVVDDDDFARMALETLLSRDDRTRVFSTADHPLAAAAILRKASVPPDVILLDVQFVGSGEAGLEAIPRMRALAPGAAVLVVSVSREDRVVREALARGADGFVCKADSSHAIAEAVVRVAQGQSVVSESIAQDIFEGIREVDRLILECMPHEPVLLKLTSQVRRTVYLYCLCGLTARQIADEMCVSVSTVYSYIQDAYRLLGAANRDEAFRALTRNRA